MKNITGWTKVEKYKLTKRASFYPTRVYEVTGYTQNKGASMSFVVVAGDLEEATTIAKKNLMKEYSHQVKVKYAGKVGRDWNLPARVGVY